MDGQNADGETLSTDTGIPVSGATFETSYLKRKQEVVPVTRSDLDDLIEFDSSELAFGGFGMFLLSGAVWLAAEKLLEQKQFGMNPLLWLCLLCVVVGIFLVIQAWRMHYRKIKRITRIYSETSVVSTSDPFKGIER